MSCIKCTKCIPIYQKYFPSNWKKWYFGFFFKACYIEPEELFWGNPYAPIWFVGRNPGGDPKILILDERWELFLKNWGYLSRVSNHFKKYSCIINDLFSINKNLANYYTGFCDAVKCYSESFAPHPGANRPNTCNKKIYETCLENYFIKYYNKFKPYVIVFRGALDKKMSIDPKISYKDEIINVFRKNGIQLNFTCCSSSSHTYTLEYAVDYENKILVILALFSIDDKIYCDYIPMLIRNFFYELNRKTNNSNLCNPNQNVNNFWNSLLSNLVPKKISYTFRTTTIGKLSSSDIDDVYNNKPVDCSKYCKNKDIDSEKKEKDILDIYEDARKQFDQALLSP